VLFQNLYVSLNTYYSAQTCCRLDGMDMPLGLGRIDLGDWVRGVVAAFIGGGAGAVTGAFSVTTIDPDHFKMGGTKFFEVAAMIFAVTGFLNMMAFLHQKPLPEMKTVATGTVTEIHQEPRTPAPIDTTEA